MEKVLDLLEIKTLFPNEWVLIGNPVFDDSKLEVLSGIPLFHSEDKKEVCYIGREKTVGFNKITLIYTGKLKSSRKITGIFNRITIYKSTNKTVLQSIAKSNEKAMEKTFFDLNSSSFEHYTTQ